jgi:hypothetical protein
MMSAPGTEGESHPLVLTRSAFELLSQAERKAVVKLVREGRVVLVERRAPRPIQSLPGAIQG